MTHPRCALIVSLHHSHYKSLEKKHPTFLKMVQPSQMVPGGIVRSGRDTLTSSCYVSKWRIIFTPIVKICLGPTGTPSDLTPLCTLVRNKGLQFKAQGSVQSTCQWLLLVGKDSFQRDNPLKIWDAVCPCFRCDWLLQKRFWPQVVAPTTFGYNSLFCLVFSENSVQTAKQNQITY